MATSMNGRWPGGAKNHLVKPDDKAVACNGANGDDGPHAKCKHQKRQDFTPAGKSPVFSLVFRYVGHFRRHPAESKSTKNLTPFGEDNEGSTLGKYATVKFSVKLTAKRAAIRWRECSGMDIGGLMLGFVAGKAVVGLASKQQTSIDLTPFRENRFWCRDSG